MVEQTLSYLTEHRWVLDVFLTVLATGVVHAAARLLMRRLSLQLERTRNLYDDSLVEAARGPLGWGIWVIGISWAAQLVDDTDANELFAYVDQIRQVAVIGLLVWFAVRFIGRVEDHISDAGYRENPVDKTTATAVGKLLRASVIITGALMVLQGLGFSISGVLAFGGIGGIAIGFAARDMLANFFGALMIFLDRPFAVGDWVRSPDREIEGTVEEIGWRLTRIRTFDQRPLFVPNSVFSTLTVENPSRMLNRRIYETVGVRYDDVGVLAAIVADVETMLKEHPDIDQARTLMVNFVRFGPSSLDFMVYTFTRTVVWAEFHAVKQDVLFRIADIIAGHGAEIAFPTQTLHLAGAAEDDAAASRRDERAAPDEVER
ncbi:MAG: mechanosensitive ion channel family protein [Pseudomonadales bacterium]